MWTVVAALIALAATVLVPAIRGDFSLPRASRVKTLVDLRARDALPSEAAERLDRLIVSEVEELELRERSRSRDALDGRPFWDRAMVLYARWTGLVFLVFVVVLELTGYIDETQTSSSVLGRVIAYGLYAALLTWAGNWIARKQTYELLKRDLAKG